MSLGGNVCIRDGDRLDYPWRECVQSLLPVVDVCVVCDGGSTDGTLEAIREWCEREPKLRLCCYPWTDPKADLEFWVNWLNFCREHIPCTYQIQLDGDEILDEHSYRAVRNYAESGQRHTLRCQRLNFWKDHRNLIPHGVCLGHEVVRLAPQEMWLPSDGAHPKGAQAVAESAPSKIRLFHYGFLRRPDAYFAKSKLLHGYFFNGYDKRLADVETAMYTLGVKNWMESIQDVEWTNRLVAYDGPHPKLAHDWLRARGYEP
jgi:glycosyltransferase involved in cell wall biosynthesis